MNYYLITQEDAEGVSVAIVKAQDDATLQRILNMLQVSHEATITNIEHLQFNPLGFYIVYEKENEPVPEEAANGQDHN